MKLLTILCLIITTSAFAQKGDNREVADKFFDNGEYYLASDYYGRALKEEPNDAYLNYKLAECYRLYFDYLKAEKQYLKAGKTGANQQFPLTRFWYAMMLKSNGKYQKAFDEFGKFLESFKPENEEDNQYNVEAILEQSGCELAIEELKKPLRDFGFENLPSPVNSEFSEYAPTFYRNDKEIVLASTREGTKGNEIDVRLGGQYSDIFRFEMEGSKWQEMANKDNFSTINTVRNDGAGVFNKEGTKFYYTSCLEAQYPCAIYISKLEDGKWTKGELLNDNVNTRGFETKQPALTTSGDTLFFVSDRPEGYGNNDIWFSVKSGEGEEWQPSKNMGPRINTQFLDMSPSYYPIQNILFFVSNGHQGFGGLDIFEYHLSEEDIPRNIGLPFNSNRDDFYFHLGEEKGVMSSNREGGRGSDDIYYFNIESKEIVLAKVDKDSLLAADIFKVLATLTYTSNGDPAVDIPVMLTDEDGNLIRKTSTDQYGQVEFDDVPSNMSYKVMLEEDRQDLSSTVFLSGANGDIDISDTRQGKVLALIIKEQLQSIGTFALLSSLKKSPGGEPAVDVPILLVDDDGNILKRTRTNSEGLIRFENLDTDKNYRMVVDEDFLSLIENVGYTIGDTKLIFNKEKTLGEAKFENIYFDYNDYKIRPEAEKTLDELATYLKDNKQAQVEISAYADASGREEYNTELSKKRGDEVMRHLKLLGADQSSLVINARGESNPIASNENPIGMQLNRRAEFVVTGGSGYQTKVMTYIIETPGSLDQVATQFGMTANELKQMNNIRSNELQGLTPLRVRKTGDNGLIAPITMASASKPGKSQSYQGSMSLAESHQPPPLEAGQEYYVVEPLNTLFGIAKMHGMTVEELKELNNLSSNRLQIGWRLVVAPKQIQSGAVSPGRYVVKEGDTMSDIADRYGMTVSELREMNNLDSNVLYSGMALKVKQE